MIGNLNKIIKIRNILFFCLLIPISSYAQWTKNTITDKFDGTFKYAYVPSKENKNVFLVIERKTEPTERDGRLVTVWLEGSLDFDGYTYESQYLLEYPNGREVPSEVKKGIFYFGGWSKSEMNVEHDRGSKGVNVARIRIAFGGYDNIELDEINWEKTTNKYPLKVLKEASVLTIRLSGNPYWDDPLPGKLTYTFNLSGSSSVIDFIYTLTKSEKKKSIPDPPTADPPTADPPIVENTNTLVGGCIDSDATNFCSECNADCSNVSGGTDTHCCRYNEEYSLKYTYRFCNSQLECKGGEGTTLKAGEVYKLRYRDSRTIKVVIQQLKDKIGDLIIKTNTKSKYNLVEYGFYSDVTIPDSDLEDFATAIAIILFGNAAIDNRLKYLDGGDILEESNTFKYSRVTIYTAGAGQLYLGNYQIISPNTEAISSRIEGFKDATTTDIIKNQLNWLAKNNKTITGKVPTYKIVDDKAVWSVTSDMKKSINSLQKIIDKYMPGQYIISETGKVSRKE